MKTAFILALALAMIGCAPKPDGRIAQLEKDVAELKAEQERVRTIITDGLSAIEKNMQAPLAALTNQLGLAVREMAGSLNAEMNNAIGRAINDRFDEIRKLPAVAAGRPAIPPQAARPLKNGVPAEIYDQIAQRAAEKWPGNFNMQEYEIKQQVTAYQNLQVFK